MKVILNGQEQELPTPQNISIFLSENGFADKVVAVAINGTFVPKSAHQETLVNDGDKVEIVAPMQGG